MDQISLKRNVLKMPPTWQLMLLLCPPFSHLCISFLTLFALLSYPLCSIVFLLFSPLAPSFFRDLISDLQFAWSGSVIMVFSLKQEQDTTDTWKYISWFNSETWTKIHPICMVYFFSLYKKFHGVQRIEFS